jgi:hypothetical protein
MATAFPNTAVLERPPRLTSPQLCWLMVQSAGLACVLVWQFSSKPEAVKLFWSDPTGNHLAVSALLLTALNFAILLGGWSILHRLANASLRGQLLLRQVLPGMLCVACFVCCYIPVFFILLIGPATLSIRNTMLAP